MPHRRHRRPTIKKSKVGSGRLSTALFQFASGQLKANKIEVCFIPSPNDAIPQLGVGGYSPGPNNLLVYLDPGFDNIREDEILATLLHESHHCMRWRNPGYGRSLGQAMVSEGLACLYEWECMGKGKPPIYVEVDLKKSQVEQALKHFDQTPYDRGQWFFGRGSLPLWFGYALGYRLSRQYSESNGQSAAQLVNVSAAEIYQFAKQ